MMSKIDELKKQIADMQAELAALESGPFKAVYDERYYYADLANNIVCYEHGPDDDCEFFYNQYRTAEEAQARLQLEKDFSVSAVLWQLPGACNNGDYVVRRSMKIDRWFVTHCDVFLAPGECSFKTKLEADGALKYLSDNDIVP